MPSVKRSSDSPPAPKKARKSEKNETKPAKGKAAKLSLLPTLPLDVLFEIFGILKPTDLLTLSRTTKDFRRLLLHKSAVSIWKTSLRQISVPACPPDMSEPSWVNLLFSPFCHGPDCSHRSQKVDWLLRIRLCDKCARTSDMLRPDRDVEKDVLECIPVSSTFRVLGHKGPCCLDKDVQHFTEILESEKDKEAFIEERKDALEARKSHAKACTSWIESMKSEREDELSEIRSQRRSDIFDKLEELGFIEELEYLEGLDGRWDIRPPLVLFNDHADMKISKPLTERNWKNMQQRVVQYMNGVRDHMHAADRLDIVRQREEVAISAWVQFRMRFPAERLLPSGSDVLSWPEVKAITELHSCIPHRYKDDDFSRMHPGPAPIFPSSFTQIFEDMAGFLSRWEESRVHDLAVSNGVGSLLSIWGSSPQDIKDLQLATCVFACEDPQNIHHRMSHYDGFYPCMWYPEFLHHPCNTVGKPVEDKDVPSNPALKAPDDFPWVHRKEWNMHSMFFDEKASRATKKVIAACGLNADYTTVENMDERDPWLICLKCSYGAKCDGQRGRRVMPWRNAVQHTMLKHWGDASVTWEKVNDESVREARKLSAAKSVTPTNGWRCAHCRDSAKERKGRDTEQAIKLHIRDKHKIQGGGVLGRDYHRALDCPPLKASVQMTPTANEVATN
ncbi:hypothetical protein FB45DRAFT_844247 [Roridomyces roridus]|uniref:F-box domain-containing protein n=1 Tax=Roridomyces roridus TaxID=1738132 RepID=A0AAD7B504_9AGAR|nr:hypothetical protein FB45DRAFT_844247 [Roridomyces roridus]